MSRIRIEVPATSANLGPGFDAFALALTIVNTIHAEFLPDSDDVILAGMTGEAAEPLDPMDNLLCLAYRRWGEATDSMLPGVRFNVENAIPIGRGLGASAAAVVAGLAAGAFAAGEKQPKERLLQLASIIEGHPDNAVAAVLGGMTVAFIAGETVHAMNVVNHMTLGVGLFVPAEPLLTVEARAILPTTVPLTDAVFDIGRAAYLATALIWGRWELIGPAMSDRLHQPYRARVLPALDAVIEAATSSGAYGAALSGGGPAVLALGPREDAERFTAAMEACARERSWEGKGMVSGIRHLGVQVIAEKE